MVQEMPSTEIKSPFNGPRADLGERARASDTIVIVAATVAALYFGREVLVPIALAVLLSIVLAPVATALARLRIGRTGSVVVSVLLALGLLVAIGGLIGRQVSQLADNLPQYETVIGKKLESIRGSTFSRGVVEKAAGALQGLDQKLTKSPSQQTPTALAEGALSPGSPYLAVEVHEPAPGAVQIVESIIAALLPPLATSAVVAIFVVFILLQRDDIRDRFIGLIGARDLHRTTAALDDAALRLSRYFLALTGVNAVFGIVIAVGLSLIGVPNPFLWGVVGGVLRFVPYVGAVVAAAFPLALAAAVDPAWSMIVETGLLFVVLETLMGQVVEPRLFGHTTGLSPLAIVLAAAFWTLLWGPPGLLLSTPITACLVVLGRHVENLKFIELLLGDKPALSPVQRFYQRILAADPDEVAYQAEALLKDMPLLDYYETVALPALALAQIDVVRGVLDRDRQIEVCSSVERVVAELSEYDVPNVPELLEAQPIELTADSASPVDSAEPDLRSVLCLAGRTPLDQAACAILVQSLATASVSTRLAGPEALATRGIVELRDEHVRAICIFYLDHRSIAPIRYAVRRVRRQYPKIPIGVCIWGNAELSALGDVVGADKIVGSLNDAVDFCKTAMGEIPTASIGVEPSGHRLANA